MKLIKLTICLLLILFISACQNDTDKIPALPENDLTSLGNEPLLQQLLSELREDKKGSSAVDDPNSILKTVDWGKVRKLTQPSLDRTAYSAGAWQYGPTGVYLNNLVLVKRGEKNYTYIIRYTPYDQSTTQYSLTDFKGTIEVFDIEGNKMANMVEEEKGIGSIKSETTCFTEIHYTWTQVCSNGSCGDITQIEWTEVEYCYSTPDGDGGNGWNGDNYEGDGLEPLDDGGGTGIPVYEPDSYCIYWIDMGLNCSDMEVFEQDYKRRMSQKELQIFEQMSELNKAQFLRNAWEAQSYAEKYFPNSVYNGKGDAVRHALFHAMNTVSIGNTLSKQLGDAHEDQNSRYPYEWKEVNMDLHNNQVGREWSNWFERGYYSGINESIIAALEAGELVYLNNLDNNGRATALSVLVKSNN
ncbi:hypothetical protein [uncultured Roseivirga sp.]|uniref:DUF6973 domain-containing protein n=1 Tax=uncultured Roseivirga sp. TaxID=543088 RepID=UPI0030D8C6BE|tara:strand:- start:62197 stop:63435 length:1239 start_codon:yes stop_codon:yes gene_type:complete